MHGRVAICICLPLPYGDFFFVNVHFLPGLNAHPTSSLGERDAVMAFVDV